MPNISKINAVDIGNIAKVDGATSSNIAKVDGLDFVTLLLDTYTGAAAAYSIRQLKTGVTIAMRVRRDTAGGTGDDDEADIAFDTSLTKPTISLDSAISNTISSASTLGEFLNVGTVNSTTYSNPDSLTVTASCFVDEWKDQSGNSNHVTQATFGSQPQIHSGTVNTDLITENGKPALDFDGTNDGLNCSTNLRASTGASTVIQVRNVPKDSLGEESPFIFYKVQRHIIDQIGASNYNEVGISTNETANEYLKYTLADLSGQLLHFATWDGSTQTGGVDEVALYEDGAQLTGTVGSASLGVSASGTNSIGFRNDLNSQYCDGTFQEVIVWLSDQDSAGNRTGIETNINGFFGIY